MFKFKCKFRYTLARGTGAGGLKTLSNIIA
jgi:hypothetical protein